MTFANQDVCNLTYLRSSFLVKSPQLQDVICSGAVKGNVFLSDRRRDDPFG